MEVWEIEENFGKPLSKLEAETIQGGIYPWVD